MTFDIAIVGGGIVGLATAMQLARQRLGSLVLLEAESLLASHQTGHNSGVIHSGLYYPPGSKKAVNCCLGREAMYRFCAQHELPHEQTGKLVVATDEQELPALEMLEARGRANGLLGIRRLVPEEMREIEPQVAGVAGLFVPQTGIVDYVAVANRFAELAAADGAEIKGNARLQGCRRDGPELVLSTTAGDIRTRILVNCAGLESDRVAKLCGVSPGVRIVPFRGEYYEIVPERASLVKNLIYPVPDPGYPFLGVHFTRKIGGGVEIGPNAVVALSRHGYRKGVVNLRDVGSLAGYGGFWKLILSNMKMGLGELYRSYSTGAMVRQMQKLVPALEARDVVRAGAGVRAQAVWPDGRLLDDFHIVEAERMIHVLNAPSPAATASISIGETIASLAAARFKASR
ncbi:MAG: L-2-hydroxyglutarate oxidase [Planctomycetota bacterium]|nr:MAG: L-2-hydroxyglutarate oxidase [Planctomycetota bacterium]REK44235.1 MAG: L-2-hydroxyglutarate oxidase [Planctomycetota bacterium]